MPRNCEVVPDVTPVNVALSSVTVGADVRATGVAETMPNRRLRTERRRRNIPDGAGTRTRRMLSDWGASYQYFGEAL